MYQDVGRFDVAVDDALGLHEGDALGHVQCHLYESGPSRMRHAALPDAFEQLVHVAMRRMLAEDPDLLGAHVVGGTDVFQQVRMLQALQHLYFLKHKGRDIAHCILGLALDSHALLVILAQVHD